MVIQKKPEDNIIQPDPQAAFQWAHAVSLPRRSRDLKGYLWAFGMVLLIVLGALAAAWTSEQRDYFLENQGKLAATLLLLTLYMGFTLSYYCTSVRRDVRRWLKMPQDFWGVSRWVPLVRLSVFVVASVGLYSFYGVMTGVWSGEAALRVLCFTAIPLGLSWKAQQTSPHPTVFDGLAVASVWLPFNFGLISSIWTWPQGEAAYVLNTPLAMSVALVGFASLRSFSFVGFRAQFKWTDLQIVLLCLGAFMALALPVGLATGFLGFNPRIDTMRLVATPLGIFFFIALPEELLFRGIILGLIRSRLRVSGVDEKKSMVWALLISSFLFGISHWHDFGPPPLTYVSLASVAGIFYGWTYIKTRSLTAAVLLHTLVDVLWELFFHA